MILSCLDVVKLKRKKSSKISRMAAEIQWHLVSQSGADFLLPQTMIFLGREECDVTLQSRSVDKRHAVITYDHYEKRFKVKDLNSANGTYVNDTRIPEQSYVKLEHMDTLRFGYATVYHVRRVEHSPTTATTPVADGRLPNWAARELTAIKLAECQGCIHEHALQHTCGMKEVHVDKELHRPSSAGATVMASPVAMSGMSGPHSLVTDCCGNTVMSPMDPSPLFDTATCIHHQPLGNAAFHQIAYVHPMTNSGHYPIQQLHSPPLYGYSHPCASTDPHAVVTTSPVSVMKQIPSTDMGNGSNAPKFVDINLKTDASDNSALQSAYSGDSLDRLSDGNLVPNEQEHSKLPSNWSEMTKVSEVTTVSGVTTVYISGNSSYNNSVPLSQDSTKQSVSSPVSNKDNRFSPVASMDPVLVSANNTVKQSSEVTSPLPSPDSEEKAIRRGLITAFTIDFTDTKPTNKKLDIKDSISKFAPPKPEDRPGHRRNLSLGRVDEHKVIDTFSDENGNPNKKRKSSEQSAKENQGKQGELSLEKDIDRTATFQKKSATHSRRGYHSEGYFSSDQDDDRSAKSDLPGAKKMKNPEKELPKSGGFVQQLLNFTDINKGKAKEGNSLNSSAAYLINKMLGNDKKSSSSKKNVSPTKKSSSSSKKKENISAAPSKIEKDPEIPLRANRESGGRLSISSVQTYVIEKHENPKLGKSDKKGKDVTFESDEETKDNMSESGTYTIEKDHPNKELEEARRNIDKVFGITVEEEEEEAVISGPRIRNVTPELVKTDVPLSADVDNSKQKGVNRDKSSWLANWALSAAQQRNHTPSPEQESCELPPVVKDSTEQENPVLPSQSHSTTNGKQSARTPTSEGQTRTRRKLPVPPVDKAPFTLKKEEITDADRESTTASNKKRLINDQASADGSFDTERLLKETETVVSAMEARMDKHKVFSSKKSELLGSSLESHDSGGESDVDTSTASHCTDPKSLQDKNIIGKRLSAQLKAKLKILDNTVKNPPKNKASSTSGQVNIRSRSLSLDHDNLVASDNISECETASLASDVSSSSDISGSSSKARRKHSDKIAPPMKFNRAFSLRRARLGYSSDVGGNPEKSKTTVNGSEPISTKGRSEETKKSTSVKNKSTSSLSRNDGGRFSLRMGKNGKKTGVDSGSRGDISKVTKHKLNTSSSSTRSNSTVSSKETEMKNWRRRKEYDPMKAAAEGRKREAAKKVGEKPKAEPIAIVNSTSNFQRSASFHGTEGLHRLRKSTYTSEDDMAFSLEDEPYLSVPENMLSNNKLHIGDINAIERNSTLRKTPNLEEYISEATLHNSQMDLGSPTFVRSSQSSSSLRHKNKMEALDNLVITTIHQLSSKLCNSSGKILLKVKSQCKDDREKINVIDDILEHLSVPDTPTSTGGHTISRELSGTLKDLKKLEKSLQTIEKMIGSSSHIPKTDCPEKKHSSEKSATSQQWNGFKEQDYY